MSARRVAGGSPMSAPLPGNVIARPWRSSRRWPADHCCGQHGDAGHGQHVRFHVAISAAPAGCSRYIFPIGCTLRRGTAIPAQKSPSPAIVAPPERRARGEQGPRTRPRRRTGCDPARWGEAIARRATWRWRAHSVDLGDAHYDQGEAARPFACEPARVGRPCGSLGLDCGRTCRERSRDRPGRRGSPAWQYRRF